MEGWSKPVPVMEGWSLETNIQKTNANTRASPPLKRQQQNWEEHTIQAMTANRKKLKQQNVAKQTYTYVRLASKLEGCEDTDSLGAEWKVNKRCFCSKHGMSNDWFNAFCYIHGRLFSACRIRSGLVGHCHSTATPTSIAYSLWSASCPSLAWPPAHILLTGAWLHCKQMTEVTPWPRTLGTNCCFATLSSTPASSLSGNSFWKEACWLLLILTRPSRTRSWSSWAH